jgi:hypothetical protein
VRLTRARSAGGSGDARKLKCVVTRRAGRRWLTARLTEVLLVVVVVEDEVDLADTGTVSAAGALDDVPAGVRARPAPPQPTVSAAPTITAAQPRANLIGSD